MKEITRIVTVEMTGIIKDAENIIPKDDLKANMKNDLKYLFGADDVVVTNIQDFVRDI